MRVLIDIGHPGHVHYFRNLYIILQNNGHPVLVISRNKDVTFELLNHYRIPFISRGNGNKSFWGKLYYLITSSFKILKKSIAFKPDVIISFASPYVSLSAFLLRCNNIVLDDTEVGRFEQFIYKPFASLILTPKVFKKNLGEKQIRFDGYVEMTNLLPDYFKPDSSVLHALGVSENESFVIIRFVSWEASHDKGEKGLTLKDKKEIIEYCSTLSRIFISSENSLPPEFEKYKLNISPYQLHDALYYAKMYIGEGATTASEAVILGTPAIYINSITAGTIEDQQESGLFFHFKSFEGVLGKVQELFTLDHSNTRIIARDFIKDKIDLTRFLFWLIENSPESYNQLSKNPDIQYRFKYNG